MAKLRLLCLVLRRLKPSLLRLGRISNFLKCFIVIFSEKQTELLLATPIRLQMQKECSSSSSRTAVTIFLSVAPGKENKSCTVSNKLCFILFYRTVNL